MKSKNPQSDINKEVSSDVPLKGLVEKPEGRKGDKAGLTLSLTALSLSAQPCFPSRPMQCAYRRIFHIDFYHTSTEAILGLIGLTDLLKRVNSVIVDLSLFTVLKGSPRLDPATIRGVKNHESENKGFLSSIVLGTSHGRGILYSVVCRIQIMMDWLDWKLDWCKWLLTFICIWVFFFAILPVPTILFAGFRWEMSYLWSLGLLTIIIIYSQIVDLRRSQARAGVKWRSYPNAVKEYADMLPKKAEQETSQ